MGSPALLLPEAGCAQRGATMVEASLGIATFLFIIFGIIELGRFMYNAQRANQALLAAAAEASYLPDTYRAKELESIKETVLQAGARYGLTLDAEEVSVCRLMLQSCETDGSLIPGQKFKVSATIPYQLGWPLTWLTISHLHPTAVSRLEGL